MKRRLCEQFLAIRGELKKLRVCRKFKNAKEKIYKEVRKMYRTPDQMEISFKIQFDEGEIFITSIQMKTISLRNWTKGDFICLHKQMKEEVSRKTYEGCSDIRCDFFVISFTNITE